MRTNRGTGEERKTHRCLRTRAPTWNGSRAHTLGQRSNEREIRALFFFSFAFRSRYKYNGIGARLRSTRIEENNAPDSRRYLVRLALFARSRSTRGSWIADRGSRTASKESFPVVPRDRRNFDTGVRTFRQAHGQEFASSTETSPRRYRKSALSVHGSFYRLGRSTRGRTLSRFIRTPNGTDRASIEIQPASREFFSEEHRVSVLAVDAVQRRFSTILGTLSRGRGVARTLDTIFRGNK